MLLTTIAVYCIVTDIIVQAYNVDNVTISRISLASNLYNDETRVLGDYYFGYDFTLDVDTQNQTRFILATSNLSRGNERNHHDLGNHGDIYEETFVCPDDSLEVHFAENISYCSLVAELHPPGNPKVFGEENILTCNPGKNFVCENTLYKPGFCSKSRDNGKTWTELPHQENIDCPVFNVDLMFVLDGSGSIGNRNFRKVIKWVLDISREFDIDGGIVRVGVVQFSHWYSSRAPDDQPHMRTEIGLGEHYTFEAFSDALRKVTLHSYTTYTAHALNVTAENFMTSSRFNDSSTKKVMILLTDGASHDSEYLPYSADYIRSLGIKTYAIGVGPVVNKGELRIIATGDVTDSRNVYEVRDFNGLKKIVEELQVEILKNVLEGGTTNAPWTFDLEFGQVGFTFGYSDMHVGISLLL